MKIFIWVAFLTTLIIHISYADTEYIVAVNDAPPYRIIEDVNYSGIYIDIINKVASNVNIRLTFKKLPFQRALNEMEIGTVDIMLGPNKSKEREKFLFFIESYPLPKEDKAFYYSTNKNIINCYSDLYNKTIEVLRGAKYFEKFDNDKKLNKYEISSYERAMKKVEAGRSDLVIIPEQQGDYLIRKYDFRLYKAPYKAEGYPSYITISKNSKNFEILKLKLIEGLQNIENTSHFNQIIEKYTK